jgi:cell division protein ZapA (FtsZ GTPase activity inhibitor)
MSYSFNVKAVDKAHAIEEVRKRMRAVAEQQPVHNKDQLHVVATVKTFIDMLRTDEERDVQVSVNGSISTTEEGVSNIALSVSAHLVQRTKA